MAGKRPTKSLVLILALVLGAFLAGCRTAEPPAGSASVRGTVHQDPDFPILGLSLFLIDPSYFPGDVYLHDQGSYVTSMASVRDGGFDLPLPEEEEFPPELLVPAAEGVENVNVVEGCELLSSSDSAMVTLMAFDFTPIPSLWAFFPNVNPGFAVASANFPVGDVGETFLSWTYASEDVGLATIGTGCGGLTVDLELDQGWNQVGWTFDEQRVMTLTNAEDEDVNVTPLVVD